MKKRKWILSLFLVGICTILSPAQHHVGHSDTLPPLVEAWYGTSQSFGNQGLPQPQINILGRVSDAADGVQSLTYSVNSDPARTANLGPDGFRLTSPGDFNIEIDYRDLAEGPNDILLTARDTVSNVATERVLLTLSSAGTWPEPYYIDWSGVSDVQDPVQVVDGLWTVDPAATGVPTLRTADPGYERAVALGEAAGSGAWDDYEILVPITIHSLDSAGYTSTAGGPGVGILFRWSGHSGDGNAPSRDRSLFGAAAWYRSLAQDGSADELQLLGNGHILLDTLPGTLAPGATFNLRMRVETREGIGGLYRARIWESSAPEPTGWDLTGQGGPADPQDGSILLLAHYADVSFGNIQVNPLPIISGIQSAPGITAAVISWDTDVFSTGVVDYGLSTAFSHSVTSDLLTRSHSVDLSGLAEETQYFYRITAGDAVGNQAGSEIQTFTTQMDAPLFAPFTYQSFTATAGTDRINLAWTNPTDLDLAVITVRRDTAGYPQDAVSGTGIYDSLSPTPGASGTFPDTTAAEGTLYYYVMFAQDTSAVWDTSISASNSDTAEWNTPPGTVTGFTATPGTGQIDLAWTIPGDPDLAEVLVLRTETDYATSHTTAGAVSFSAGTGTTFSDTTAAEGTTYNYAAFTRDTADNWNDTVTPGTTAANAAWNTPPGTVTNFTATPGTGQIDLAWDNPADPDLAEVLVLRTETDYATSHTTAGAVSFS
ncbi:MAG: hypothetical protein JSV26_09425, partial [bacterium]